jgi:hypothetical protein
LWKPFWRSLYLDWPCSFCPFGASLRGSAQPAGRPLAWFPMSRFGAERIDDGEFSAHAWLRLGSYVVTGGSGHQRFKVFTTFARKHS